MESTLETRYGWLLLTYPAPYRRARGAEMVGTLMESARPGQRWPSPADAVDLIAGGLRHRAGLSAVPGLARGLALAGPIALAFAGGLGAYYMIAEFTAMGLGYIRDIYRGWGPVPTLGPFVLGAWLLAALGRIVLPRLASRWLIGAALAVTVLVVPVAHALDRTRPTLPMLAPLALLGLLALAGTAHAPPRRERTGVGIGLVAVAGALIGLTNWYLRDATFVSFDPSEPFRPIRPNALAIAWSGASTTTVAGLAMLALLVGLLLAGVRHRPALWAAGLLLVPGLPLVAPLGPELAAYQFSSWVLMPTGLAAAVVVLASAIRLAWRDPASGPRSPKTTAEGSLAIAGTLALGTAAGVAVVAWSMNQLPNREGLVSELYPGWRGFTALVWPVAAAVSVLPVRGVARAAVAAAIAATIVLPPRPDLHTYDGRPLGLVQTALVMLGVVALAGLPAGPPRRIGSRLGGLAAAAALCAMLAWLPGWWETGSVLLSPYAVALGGATAFLIGVVAGGSAVLEPLSPQWWRGAVVLLGSSGWIGVAAPRFLGVWQTSLILAGLVVIVSAAGVWAALRARAQAAPPDVPA
jgi:hypothetical protein